MFHSNAGGIMLGSGARLKRCNSGKVGALCFFSIFLEGQEYDRELLKFTVPFHTSHG